MWLKSNKQIKEEIKTKENELNDLIEEKKEKYDLFKVITSAFNKKYEPTLEEKQKINEWVFMNYVSNSPDLIEIVNEFNIREIPIEFQYDILKQITPKMFIKYPKKTKRDEMFDEIIDKYKVSYEVAREYYKISNN